MHTQRSHLILPIPWPEEKWTRQLREKPWHEISAKVQYGKTMLSPLKPGKGGSFATKQEKNSSYLRWNAKYQAVFSDPPSFTAADVNMTGNSFLFPGRKSEYADHIQQAEQLDDV